jgi:hypothetical protein
LKKQNKQRELRAFNKLLVGCGKTVFYDGMTKQNATKKPWLEPGLFTPKHIEP